MGEGKAREGRIYIFPYIRQEIKLFLTSILPSPFLFPSFFLPFPFLFPLSSSLSHPLLSTFLYSLPSLNTPNLICISVGIPTIENSPWVSTSGYFVGLDSGLMLCFYLSIFEGYNFVGRPDS